LIGNEFWQLSCRCLLTFTTTDNVVYKWLRMLGAVRLRMSPKWPSLCRVGCKTVFMFGFMNGQAWVNCGHSVTPVVAVCRRMLPSSQDLWWLDIHCCVWFLRELQQQLTACRGCHGGVDVALTIW